MSKPTVYGVCDVPDCGGWSINPGADYCSNPWRPHRVSDSNKAKIAEVEASLNKSGNQSQ